MSEAVMMVAHDVKAGVGFVWRGGPYVDVFWSDALAIRGTGDLAGDDQAVPFTTINVWDYEAGAARISGRAGFEGACREWLAENKGDLGSYLENSL